MCKKIVYLVCLVLVLGLVGDVQAQPQADVTWTDATGDHNWFTPENWDSNSVPTFDDGVIISTLPGPTIASEGAIAFRVFFRYGTGALTVDGGTLWSSHDLTMPRSNHEGTLNMISGTITVDLNFWVGRFGPGTLNMTGGQITANNFVIGDQAAGSGHVDLDGGIITTETFSMRISEGSVGTMNVTAGTLIINGDNLSTVQGYIDNGWITAYDGKGTLQLDYDVTNTGKTTLKCLPPDPVAHWTFDEFVVVDANDPNDPNATMIIAPDASGNGNDGTLIGDTDWDPNGGMLGGAALFDGTDDSIRVRADVGPYPVSDYPFTLMGWCKTAKGSGKAVMLALVQSSGQYYWIGLKHGQATVTARTDSGTFEQKSGVGIADDQWHHLCGVYVGPEERILYLDGVEVTNDIRTSPFLTGIRQVAVGALDRDPDGENIVDEMDGSVDDVRLYDVALPVDEIQAVIESAWTVWDLDMSTDPVPDPMQVREGKGGNYVMNGEGQMVVTGECYLDPLVRDYDIAYDLTVHFVVKSESA